MLPEILAYNKSALCRSASSAFSFVLCYVYIAVASLIFYVVLGVLCNPHSVQYRKCMENSEEKIYLLILESEALMKNLSTVSILCYVKLLAKALLCLEYISFTVTSTFENIVR